MNGVTYALTMENAMLLHAITETALDGIITIDSNGVIEAVNSSALKIFGYREEELIGQNISLLMPEPDKSISHSYLNHIQHSREKKTAQPEKVLKALRKDGSRFPIRLILNESQSDSVNYTVFIQDLTWDKEAPPMLKNHNGALDKLRDERSKILKQKLNELQEENKVLNSSLEKEKELNRLKSRFVSMAAHEFRTPLSAMQLSVVLIEKYLEVSNEVQVSKHLQKVRNAIGSLNTMLEDCLSLDRLEIGIVKAAYHPFDIIHFAEELTDEMQLMTGEHQIIVYQNTGSESEINLDQNLLRHCLINLISNAVKYSGENTLIEFSTEINDEHYIFTVKDNGIGIPEKDQTSIFQPFFRANNTANIRGTGLGLYIVERYVNLMNGNIHFKSTPDHGTQFILSFSKTHDEN